MTTLKELSERRAKLQAKLEIFEQIKNYASITLRDGDHCLGVLAALDEVLVDIDAMCVAPILDEITELDEAEVSDGKTASKQAKKKSKPQSKRKASKR